LLFPPLTLPLLPLLLLLLLLLVVVVVVVVVMFARVCESEYVAGVASGRTISRDRRWNIEGGRSRGRQTP